MSSDVAEKEEAFPASSELELDGKIYLVTRDEKGEVLSRDELDGETCLKVMVAVLDDSLQHPYLEKLVESASSLSE
jgi:hypothetical protein